MQTKQPKSTFLKKPELIASILVVVWAFTISAVAFNGPPVGCTPESCPNGPLAQLAAENIRDGVTIAWVTGDLVKEDGLHGPNAECSDGALGTTDCKVSTDNKWLSNSQYNGREITTSMPSTPGSTMSAGWLLGSATTPDWSDCTEGQSGNCKAGSRRAGVNRGSLGSITPRTYTQSKSAGYYNSFSIAGDADLIAANIKDGVTLFWVTGSLDDAPSLVIPVGSVGLTEGGNPNYCRQTDSSGNVSEVNDWLWCDTNSSCWDGVCLANKQGSHRFCQDYNYDSETWVSANNSHFCDTNLVCMNGTCNRSSTAYNIAFVTSAEYTANLGGVNGANAICNNTASQEGIPGTYKAWISTNESNDPESTFSRYTTSIYTVNGSIIANNWADLTDGNLDRNLNVTETGEVATWYAWTNVYWNGQYANAHYCSDWTDGTSSNNGSLGWLNEWSSELWTRLWSNDCKYTQHLYCFSQ